MGPISYSVRKKAGIALLTAYCIVGTAVGDVYPFFNWALFSYVPNHQERFTVEIVRLGNEAYDPPIPFSEMRPLFDTIGQSPTEYTPRVDALGRAAHRGDTHEVRVRREEFEKIFGTTPFIYALLFVTYEPIEYWRTGTFASTTVIAVFASSDL